MLTTVTVALRSEVWATALALRIGSCDDFDAKSVACDMPRRLLPGLLKGTDILLVSISDYVDFETAMPENKIAVGLAFESEVDAALDLYIGNSRRPFIEVAEMTTMKSLAAILGVFAEGKNTFVPRIFIDQIFARREQKDYADHIGFTPAERDVMTLMAQGLSNKSIAAARFNAPRTIENHVSSIFGKLGLSEALADGTHGRVRAVTMWLMAGNPHRETADALYGATAREAASDIVQKNGRMAAT